MNVIEAMEHIKRIFDKNIQSEQNDWKGYEYIGIRFEDKAREIGEICEYSRNNTDREDEREFPEYSTLEYFELEELDGTSAWNLDGDIFYKEHSRGCEDKEFEKTVWTNHCYIIASNRLGQTSNTVIDVNEIVIKDAIVIAKIF